MGCGFKIDEAENEENSWAYLPSQCYFDQAAQELPLPGISIGEETWFKATSSRSPFSFPARQISNVWS